MVETCCVGVWTIGCTQFSCGLGQTNENKREYVEREHRTRGRWQSADDRSNLNTWNFVQRGGSSVIRIVIGHGSSSVLYFFSHFLHFTHFLYMKGNISLKSPWNSTECKSLYIKVKGVFFDLGLQGLASWKIKGK